MNCFPRCCNSRSRSKKQERGFRSFLAINKTLPLLYIRLVGFRALDYKIRDWHCFDSRRSLIFTRNHTHGIYPTRNRRNCRFLIKSSAILSNRSRSGYRIQAQKPYRNQTAIIHITNQTQQKICTIRSKKKEFSCNPDRKLDPNRIQTIRSQVKRLKSV